MAGTSPERIILMNKTWIDNDYATNILKSMRWNVFMSQSPWQSDIFLSLTQYKFALGSSARDYFPEITFSWQYLKDSERNFIAKASSDFN